jgi:hypothetical protein
MATLILGSFISATPSESAEAVRFSIPIQARKVDPAQRTLRTTRGHTVELAFTTDEPVELHLHGYDRHLRVAPGEAAVMQLEATIAGRFPIEAHRFGAASDAQSHVVLLYLEVHPR